LISMLLNPESLKTSDYAQFASSNRDNEVKIYLNSH
jgi:hypothetical protein